MDQTYVLSWSRDMHTIRPMAIKIPNNCGREGGKEGGREGGGERGEGDKKRGRERGKEVKRGR